MVDDAEADEHEGGGRSIVVVPHHPGPVVRLERPGRGRDDLDDLIDELFPDTDEGPGWFDAGLLALAAGLVAWGSAGGSGLALAGGAVALVLGGILPARWAWRRLGARRHRRHRRAVLDRGVPLDTRHPATARLVESHDELVLSLGASRLASDPGLAAAHAAVLEAATLLRGRPPDSEDERAYVQARTEAIEALTAAVRSQPDRSVPDAASDPALLIEARRELDALTGTNALARLNELTTEARRPHAPGT